MPLSTKQKSEILKLLAQQRGFVNISDACVLMYFLILIILIDIVFKQNFNTKD